MGVMTEVSGNKSFSQDMLAGLMFFAIGAIGAYQSLRFNIGTFGRMGPGFFPLVISVGLLATGLGTFVKALIAGSARVSFPTIRPLFFIIGSVFSFAWLVERWGLVVGITVLIVFARLAEPRFKPFQSALLVVGAVLVGIGLFVYGLRLPFRVFPV